jgi:hypothetical protein
VHNWHTLLRKGIYVRLQGAACTVLQTLAAASLKKAAAYGAPANSPGTRCLDAGAIAHGEVHPAKEKRLAGNLTR